MSTDTCPLVDTSVECLVQIGMRAAIRDIQEYIDDETHHSETIDPGPLRAYLLAMLITAGAYEDLTDGES